MELRKYLQIVSAYRWYLITIPLIAGVIAFAATHVLVAPKFVGTAVVQMIPDQVEPRFVSFRSEQGPGTSALGFRDPTELLAQGVSQILASREVAELVAAQLSRPPESAPAGGFDKLKSEAKRLVQDAMAWLRYGYVARGDDRDAAVESVRGALRADLVRGSYFLKIVGQWTDPQTAADVANAAVNAVLIHSRGVASSAAAERRQFLESQMSDAARRVDQARQAVLDYSANTSTVPGESVRVAVAALDTARTNLRQNEAQLADSRQRLATTEEQVGGTPRETVTTQTTDGTSAPPSTTSTTSAQNPLYITLQERATALRQDIAVLLAGPRQTELQAQNEAALVDARRRLAVAEQDLAGTPRDAISVQRTENGGGGANNTSTSRSSGQNPVYTGLRERVNTLKQDVAALEARRTELKNQGAAQNQVALADARRRLESLDQQLAELPREVVSVQTNDPGGGPAAPSTVSRSSSPNPVFQGLAERANTLKQEVTALQARQVEQQAQVRSREEDLRVLVAEDGKLAALNQQLGVASDAYSRRSADWYNALQEEARPVAPIRLIDPATAPAYPASPIKLLYAAIGAGAGLLFALVLMYVRYTTDLSLRTVAETQEALGDVRLLAVVPGRSPGIREAGARNSGTTGAG